MKYAIFENKRIEAVRGFQNAICPICRNNVIAKCGNINIHHWAHKSKTECDNWWENETSWHRNWKNNFPDDWQEYVMHGSVNSEKHVADIKTSNNLVIEFQHSSIKPEERVARENFYRNMIWVVDGTRLENDYKRFDKNKDKLKKSKEYTSYAEAIRIEEIFPKAWTNSKVPIFFDFGINHFGKPNEDKCKNLLWCLFPKEKGCDSRVIMCISKKNFIKHIKQNIPFRNPILEKEQKRIKQINYLIANINNIKLTNFKIIQQNSKELSWKKDLRPGDIYVYGDKQIYKELELIITGVVAYYKEWDNKQTVVGKHRINSKIVKDAKIKLKVYRNEHNTKELLLENGNKLEKVCDVICLILKENDTVVPALITLKSNFMYFELESKLNYIIAELTDNHCPITIFTARMQNNNYFIPKFTRNWRIYKENEDVTKFALLMKLYADNFIFTNKV